MEKGDRFPLSITPLGVAQPQTRREADRGDLQVVRLVYGLPPLRPAFTYGSYIARLTLLGRNVKSYAQQVQYQDNEPSHNPTNRADEDSK